MPIEHIRLSKQAREQLIRLKVYLALLKERCLRDGLGTEDDVLASQFRLHLHRGIAYLSSDRRLRDGIGAFVAQAAA